MSAVPGSTALRLFPHMLRFVARESLRPRRALLIGPAVAVAVLEVSLAWRQAAESRSAGAFLMIGLLLASAPLCRSWPQEDVRLGYGAFWIQKPISPTEFYLSRLLAATVLGMAIGAALGIAVLPALALGPTPLRSLVGLLLLAVPVPPLLVALSLLGAGLGARNGALFAYLVLFLGFWLRAFLGTLGADRQLVLRLVQPLLPPMHRLLDANQALAGAGVRAALEAAWPAAVYWVAVAVLAVLLTRRVPYRLGRAE